MYNHIHIINLSITGWIIIIYIIANSIAEKSIEKDIHHSRITMNEDMHNNQFQNIEINLNIVVINTTNLHHPLIQIHQ